MSFYQELQKQTAEDRQRLLASPIIARCQQGDIIRPAGADAFVGKG